MRERGGGSAREGGEREMEMGIRSARERDSAGERYLKEQPREEPEKECGGFNHRIGSGQLETITDNM